MPHSQPDVLIKRVLGEAGQAVSFGGMAVLGRNPARIIPAICRFTDSRHPRRTRFLDESRSGPGARPPRPPKRPGTRR